MSRNFVLQRRTAAAPSLAVAAFGFSLVWLLALAAPVPMTALDASDATAVAALAGHEAEIAIRAVLAHGLAAVAIVIVAGGIGYALLVPALAPAAYLSLPLLLVFMTGSGLALARRGS